MYCLTVSILQPYVVNNKALLCLIDCCQIGFGDESNALGIGRIRFQISMYDLRYRHFLSNLFLLKTELVLKALQERLSTHIFKLVEFIRNNGWFGVSFFTTICEMFPLE